MILTDAGPLVALIHRGDKNHDVCRHTLESLAEPMLTVWPAFTEAMYLLGFSWRGQDALWELAHRRSLSFAPLVRTDVPRMRRLMAKYKDLPMDFADAALVRIAEREKIDRVFTLDRKDFTIYRPDGIGSFVLYPEV